MARRKRPPIKPPSVPPPKTTRRSRRQREDGEAPDEGLVTSSEDLDEQYSHVRTDLIRITVLGVLMFVFLAASWYLVEIGALDLVAASPGS